jgi:hypothetical protein
MKTFQQYDQEHPEIYQVYKNIAYDYIQRGKIKMGSKSIIEEIRWHKLVKTNEYFKVSNNYTAYYARKFANEHPQYAGFFNFKPLRSTNK